MSATLTHPLSNPAQLGDGLDQSISGCLCGAVEALDGGDAPFPEYHRLKNLGMMNRDVVDAGRSDSMSVFLERRHARAGHLEGSDLSFDRRHHD